MNSKTTFKYSIFRNRNIFKLVKKHFLLEGVLVVKANDRFLVRICRR